MTIKICEHLLEEIADRAGWDDSSKIILACRFIEQEGLDEEFKNFLFDEANLEEEMAATELDGDDFE